MSLSSLTQAHGVRPSLLVGDREEFRLAERVGIAFSSIISPLMVGPMRKYRPIAAGEVARQMVALQDFS